MRDAVAKGSLKLQASTVVSMHAFNCGEHIRLAWKVVLWLSAAKHALIIASALSLVLQAFRLLRNHAPPTRTGRCSSEKRTAEHPDPDALRAASGS